MKNPEDIACLARDSLSKYCRDSCKSYCCRKGYIVLRPEEVKLIIGDKRDKLSREGSLREKIHSGRFSFNLSNSFGSCTQLKDGLCLIHKNSKRPRVCKEFPIFVNGNFVRISQKCYGVKAGLLFPFIKDLKKLGCEIEES